MAVLRNRVIALVLLMAALLLLAWLLVSAGPSPEVRPVSKSVVKTVADSVITKDAASTQPVETPEQHKARVDMDRRGYASWRLKHRAFNDVVAARVAAGYPFKSPDSNAMGTVSEIIVLVPPQGMTAEAYGVMQVLGDPGEGSYIESKRRRDDIDFRERVTSEQAAYAADHNELSLAPPKLVDINGHIGEGLEPGYQHSLIEGPMGLWARVPPTLRLC